MASLPPIPADIGRVAGPLLIGHLLNWGLFGALSLQVYMYFLAFPTDPPRSKVLVYVVYILEMIQTFLLTQSAFHGFAEGFGNLLFLDEIGTIWFSVPIMSGIAASLAQIFYAYRIYVLAQSKVLASLIVALSLVQLGGSIATGVESKRAVYNSRFLGTHSYITTGIWNGGSALCDVIIAVCMTVYLSRRNTGMKQTQRIVRKIIRLTIETGSLTAIIAILNFALVLLPGRPTYYMTTVGMLGKLYSNSMLAVFNSRIRLGTDNNPPTVNESFHSRSRNDVSHGQVGNTYPMGGVSVTREQVTFPPASGWVGTLSGDDPLEKKPVKM